MKKPVKRAPAKLLNSEGPPARSAILVNTLLELDLVVYLLRY